MDIEIRKMTLEDVESTIELCNICFEESTDIAFAKETFQKYSDDENHIYLVGLKGNKIVAHLKITIIPTIYGEMATYAILNHVCVHPDYRREHYGTHLLDAAMNICKGKNVHSVELWSKNFRTAAHALYKKYGFIPQDAAYFKKVLD
ncbi:MAG TPA: hypothetical protein DCY94_03390 [Firmicutes bacterium]|nr:hypothetical protein [Bacillota bacterium]